MFVDRRDGVVVRASASQSVDPGFPCRVIPKEFETWHPQLPCLALSIRGVCGEQAGKFACCVLGQGT